MTTFCIKVQYASRQPVIGREVKVKFHGSGRGFTKATRTDQNGVAAFSGYNPGLADIYVEGKLCWRDAMITDGSVFDVRIGDEIWNLMRDVTRDLATEISKDDRADHKRLKRVDDLLATARADYEECHYQTAEETFRRVLKMLKEYNLMEDIWAEVCVLMASCQKHLGNERAAQLALKEAYRLEPNNKKLSKLAKKWGLEWS